MSTWLPIETAPRDGTLIDLWVDGRRLPDCKWWTSDFEDDWSEWRQQYAEADSFFPISGDPTHWMPRPAPPPA